MSRRILIVTTCRSDDMSDDYQIEIPLSFMALFVEPGRQKPNASRDVVAERYELCEDMANMLTETAKNMLFSLGITEQDVFERVHRGLVGEGAVVTPAEAVWVVHRLAELLEWSQLAITPATTRKTGCGS
jgi:hypothetical protein